ncbi:MAG: rod shape-determining protein MreC [Patescibacteria group bacterium]
MKFYFQENKKIFIVSICLIIILIVFHFTRILSPVERGVVIVLRPVQSFASGLTHSVTHFFGSISEISQKEKENEDLKDQLRSIMVENSLIKTNLEENKILNPQIDYLQEKNYQYVLARVISRGVDPTFKTMVINRGTRNGLKVGLPVIAENGFLVGKIVEAGDGISQVMLLNDTRSLTSGQIQNESNSQGLIAGEFGLNLKMDFIPQNDPVKADELVITSGLENSIPKGLIIGQIDQIQNTTGEFFQKAIIVPSLIYDQLQLISVITSF